MDRKLKILISLLSLSCLTLTSFAQSKYGATPEDSIECRKNYSVYSVYYDQGNYGQATIDAWRWVFDNCPQSTKNIFIHGAKMYESFVKKEKDQKRKDEYLDTLLLIYDRRIENFGEEGKVLGYKGTDLLKYRPTAYAEAFTILEKAIDLRKNKASASVLSGYFQAAVLKYRQKEIDEKTAVEIYSKVLPIIEYNIENQKEKKKKYYEQAKQSVEGLLIQDVNPSCEVLVSILQPQYEATPEDAELLKKIISTLEGKCKDSELYVKAVESLLPLEPSAKAYESFGDMMYVKKNTAKAIESYSKAAELEIEGVKKAEIYVKLAKINSGATAVAYANKAISNDPSNGSAYIQKAVEYVKGASTCAQGDEQAAFKEKTVYWLAVDLCEKAKTVDASVASTANSLISSYKTHFPGTEEIFFQGLKVGDSYSISCWFSGTTTIRAK